MSGDVLYPTGIQTIVQDEVVSSGTDYTTMWMDIQLLAGMSFQLDWEGGTDVAGTITLEASNRHMSEDERNTYYAPIECSDVDITGISGTHIYELLDFEYRFLRLRVSLSSGNSIFRITSNSRTRVGG